MKSGGVPQKVELRNLRLEMGLTQQELADSLDMNSRYISMVESGLKPCSAKMLKKVELLVRTKNLAKPPANAHTEDCLLCAEKDREINNLRQELKEARAVIRDQASAIAALASKPSAGVGLACSASEDVLKSKRGA